MVENKTKPTKVSVTKFIGRRRERHSSRGCQDTAEAFEETTGWKAQMFGPTIVGFGLYHYKYESGHGGVACVVGFSPRKANLVIYVLDFAGKAELLEKLGQA
jgi:hypothetical protein